MSSSPRIQAHTFIRWMNNKLVKAHKPLVRSLIRDLQTALPLISLVELSIESELPFKYNPDPLTEEEKADNWRSFLSYLNECKVVDEEFSNTCESKKMI